MDIRKLKILFLLIAILLFIIVFVSVMVDKGNDNNQLVDINDINDKEFDFNETLILETEKPSKEAYMGTDYPSLGTISDYYEGTDIEYKDGKIYMEAYNGTIVISPTWMEDSLAKHIKEPEFGSLNKFVSKSHAIYANYSAVDMKDVVEYINELSGLGFSDVVKDEKDKKADTYIYSARKDDLTVTLNYEKGELVISVA